MNGTADRHGAKCDCGAVYSGENGKKWLKDHNEKHHATPENQQEKFAAFAEETALVGYNSDPGKKEFSLDEVSKLLLSQRELIAKRIRAGE
jgi:hypothetical protein